MKKLIIFCILFLSVSAYATEEVFIRDHDSTNKANLRNNALETISYVHERVHAGGTYTVCTINLGVTDDSSLDVVLEAGSLEYHVVIEVAAEGKALYFLYDTPTYSGGVTATNNNLSKLMGDSSTLVVKFNPTVSSTGTQIYCKLLPGGSGGTRSGVSIRDHTEIILAPNTDYLLRLTNTAGNTKDLNISVQWYEEQ